ncbi:hypothetical protein J0X19_08420 [Hymenobacter sp. BT186]|jgi:hypothetical protein|uniref:Uncharacterized protein n=1 Tax=Hymenobacter telluris TaxID=2816474 RepID=A0A939EWL2_9BACT|nr:hypothetical protein [Hymenobacter telluris]MBO0357965.1 hypothetical protein [Hymenobacter telluris]MBW3373992.1 hypothetical protein [Hymenobacter norwichensis]
MREFRNRLFLGLLLGALLLSAGLNVYCLRQLENQPLNYELESGLPVSMTELELAQARAELQACQESHANPTLSADTVALRSPGSFLAD